MPQNVSPIAKTNENVAKICKRFYALIFRKELGLEKNLTSNPKTHETCVYRTNDQLINNNANGTLRGFTISLNPENKGLPSFHGLCKLHKNPVKATNPDKIFETN